ncbi:MAG TPA: hypothetical protein VMM59_07280 [Thermohalobaculum sp.]|nr:hypothetical protein [Thermohalobaculum sp.]
MARYAIIGWGSLIWDLEVLAEQVRGGWAMGAGPRLPMEFTRVSPKRKRALVVCLDAEHGVGCTTNAIRSGRARIEGVIEDLARRERAPIAHIGALCLRSGHVQGGKPEVADTVRRWCAAGGWAGAVWTDLPSNFVEELGAPFSVPRGLGYLRTLAGDSLDEAVRYIEQAPPATDTPLRRALAADGWWSAEARRLGLR